MKRLVFKLKKITHKGDSVGRDISVSGTINGNPFSVSERRIQKHASREYDERLTQIDANEEAVEVPINFHCVVSERDLRWNDVGESNEQINLDLNTTTNKFSINISVAEKWWFFLKRKAVFASTWFRIMDGDEKYIHTGKVSDGCLTITNHDKWNEIYSLLILARKGDGMHIGTIKVVK